MSEYAKMKNAELEALLKSRGLPTAGKKADMVERLSKDDEEKKAAATASTAAVNPEDIIDWDDNATEPAKPAEEALATAAKATTEAGAAAIKAGGKGQVANPQAVPNQVADIDPSKTAELSVKSPTEQSKTAGQPGENKTEEANFSRGLASSDVAEEIEKRKARAKRFGLESKDDEALKLLQRSQKFGGTAPPKGLDESLPERSRKRGREGGDGGGQRKRRGGGNPGGRRGQNDRRTDGGQNDRNTKAGSWMSEADKAKAEARKNRFAANAT